MKRRVLASLTAATLAVGSIAGTSSLAFADSSDEKVVINMWTDQRADYDTMEPLIEEFNETHDNIELVYEIYTDNYGTALEIAFDNGTGPDVFGAGGNGLTIARNGQGLDLTDLLSDEIRELYGDNLIQRGANPSNGEILSLPSSGSSVRLVVNLDILEAAGVEKVPTTYQELLDAAEQVTNELGDQGIYGFAMNLKSAGSCIGRTVEKLMGMNYGITGGYDITTGSFVFEQYEETLNLFRVMEEEGWMYPGIDQLDIDPLRTAFANGEIAMYMSFSAAEYGVYTTQFPTDVNWDYYPLPALETEGEYVSVGTDGVEAAYCINKDTEHLEEALEVFEWFYGKEIQEIRYENGVSITPIAAIQEEVEPEAIKEHPYMAYHSEIDGYVATRYSGLSIEGEDYNTVMQAYILGVPGYEDWSVLAEDLNTRYTEALNRGLEDGTAVAYICPDIDYMDQLNADIQKIEVVGGEE